MRYERASFPVNGLALGGRTELRDGVLQVDREELESLALEDQDIERANVHLASPGDPVRIVNWRDIVEPAIKVDGPGTAYPAVFGRSADQVGEGRTNRLAGAAVVQCADPSGLTTEERTWPPLRAPGSFIDMAGPGGNRPYGSLHNVCVEMETRDGLTGDDWHSALGRATLKIADRLAETTLDAQPADVETFDTSPAAGKDGVVSIFNLASDEWFCGARSVLGTSIYGQTRLSAPWLLSPTELFDGAVYHSGHSGSTWAMTNNPVALKMAREHGVNCNYIGVIVQRTNWTLQTEKDLMADRLAHLAKSLGANGAVLTTDIRGQRFVETILGVRACERAGIPTVLLTQEEDNEDGTAPPLLMSAPEVVSVVSTGTGGQEEPFPAVDKVIGRFDDGSDWEKAQPPIHGQYGQAYYNDLYGFGNQGRIDY